MKPVVLSKIWWLWIPLLMVVGQLAIEVGLSEAEKEAILGEGGFHETFQAIITVSAFALAVRLFFVFQSQPWLKLWVAIAAIGALYVTGEEISWGQHLFKWGTPESWAVVNDQNETNLHNTSDWLDQKPLILLEIGVLVGGILIPLLEKIRPLWLPVQFSSIYPTYHLVPVSLIAFAMKLADTYGDQVQSSLFWRTSEILEIFLYYFVFLYLVVLRRRFS